MKTFNLHGFLYQRITEELECFKTDEERLVYSSFVLKEWILNPPRLDPNGELKPSFEERIKVIIRDLELKLNKGVLTKGSNTKQPKKENDEKIWWKGTENQLIYFIELLFKNNLIDLSQYEKRFALFSTHFKNKDGNSFKNTQLSKSQSRGGIKNNDATLAIEQSIKSVKEESE